MEAPTLEIRVEDVVVVHEGSPVRTRRAKPVKAPFQPEFRFTMPTEDQTWAPARSRAPSVLIDFDLFEATDSV